MIFLVYAGDLYFRTCCLTYGVHVSIQAYDVERDTSHTIFKNVLLLKNPSSLSFKVTYVKEEVYGDSHSEAMLGETYKSTSPGSYLTLVDNFSNVTIELEVPLSKSPSNENLFIKVYMRFEGIPILGSLYLTQSFSISLPESVP